MPRVIVMIKPGRTREQHQNLVRGVTEAVCASIDVEPESVTVVLSELHQHLVAQGGELQPEP